FFQFRRGGDGDVSCALPFKTNSQFKLVYITRCYTHSLDVVPSITQGSHAIRHLFHIMLHKTHPHAIILHLMVFGMRFKTLKAFSIRADRARTIYSFEELFSLRL